MTSNFKIIADTNFSKFQEKIEQLITKIENSIFNKSWEYVFIDGRKILENLFYEEDSSHESLDQKITLYIERNIVSSKVKNAFYFIKSKGNEDAHSVIKNTDQPFVLAKDMFSIVELLKQIFIIIKHFIKMRVENGDEVIKEYNFDSTIYLPIVEQMKKVDEIEDIKPEKESIETNLKGIFELISSEYKFLIPTYQRDYSWNKENILTLIQDIKYRALDQQHHYMGSLAIAVDEEKKVFRLIDGQQRITTSLLLIKAMIKRFEKAKNILKMPAELKKIKEKLPNKYINSTTNHGPMSFVMKILKDRFPIEEKDFTHSKGYENYLLICDELDKLSPQEFDKFYTTFIYYFVVAELQFKNDLGQEIQIFENLNSKGMELSQWDLIKNHIFKSIDFDFLLKEEGEIEILLNRLFVIKASTSFGEKKKIKKLNDFFAIYVRLISKIKEGHVLQDKGKIHKIFALLWQKENPQPIKDMDKLKKALLFVARCFEVYCNLEKRDFYNITNSPLFELNLHLLNTGAKDAHFPALINAIIISSEWNDIKLIKIKKENITLLKTFLSDIDKYITRLIVVRNVGQSLSNLFDSVITNDVKSSHLHFLDKISNNGQNLSHALPSWQEFKNELKNKNDWQKEYAFAVLRTFIYDQNSFVSKAYQIILSPSLEHIFPQKVNNNSSWFIEEKTSNFNKFVEKQKVKINKLGNYLILSQSLNSKIKNNSFPEKLLEYKKFGSSKLIYGQDNNALMNLTLKNSFTFEDIDIRSEQLANLISPLYKLSNNK